MVSLGAIMVYLHIKMDYKDGVHHPEALGRKQLSNTLAALLQVEVKVDTACH